MHMVNNSRAADWRDRAACLETSPDVMQPEVATPDQVAFALGFCDGCPVVADCRKLAEGQPLAYGVHAGEWWGDPPRNPAFVLCGWCEKELDPGPRGTRAYCDAACRKRAQRARESAA